MEERDITRLLHQAAEGNRAAFDEVAAWAYTDLERLASARMHRRYPGRAANMTLEPAALVNETFLRLLENPIGFENRRHFLAFASQVMIGALIDYERRRRADKRGGDWMRVTLSGIHAAPVPSHDGEIGTFKEALAALETLDARKADVVRLRVLWGAEVSEVARLLQISEPTVIRDWRFARTWLAERLATGA